MTNLSPYSNYDHLPVAGLHKIPRYVYDSVEAVNSTRLKRYKVPAQAKWAETHPEDTDTEALEFGRKAHMLVLEPDEFYKHYIETPRWPNGGGHLRAVKGKTTKPEAEQNRIEKIAWEAEHRDQQWIAPDEWLKLHQMKEALEADKIANGILMYPSEREVSCFAQPWGDDTWAKGMFDIVLETADEERYLFHRDDVPPGVWIGDYKTARSASPDKFKWAVRDFGYLQTACFYLDLYKAATGVEPAGFFWIAQDKSAGYTPCCYVLNYNDERLDRCRQEIAYLLKTMKRCHQYDKYPGYAETALYMGSIV